MDKIDFDSLSLNENAIDILEQYIYNVNWRNLSANPNALPILLKNPDRIDNSMLSINPNALHIIENNLNKINWYQLLCNTNIKNYLHIVENNLDNFAHLRLWNQLCKIAEPKVIDIIERNLEHVDWAILSANPAAIHLLEKNPDKISYTMLSKNPAIFVIDRDAMRKQIDNGFAEELIAKALHPRHFARNLELYDYDIVLNVYMDKFYESL
jgi:hypothetical protein